MNVVEHEMIWFMFQYKGMFNSLLQWTCVICVIQLQFEVARICLQVDNSVVISGLFHCFAIDTPQLKLFLLDSRSDNWKRPIINGIINAWCGYLCFPWHIFWHEADQVIFPQSCSIAVFSSTHRFSKPNAFSQSGLSVCIDRIILEPR